MGGGDATASGDEDAVDVRCRGVRVLPDDVVLEQAEVDARSLGEQGLEDGAVRAAFLFDAGDGRVALEDGESERHDVRVWW